MKSIVLSLLMFLSILVRAGWEPFSPEGIKANCIRFYVDNDNHWLVGSYDIYLYQPNGQTWNSYFAICPVIDGSYIDGDNILLILSSHEWIMEDGIHYLDPSSGTVYALKYLTLPHFVRYDDAIGRYYTGHRNGLVYWEDIGNWHDMAFFDGLDIVNMEIYDGYYVVSQVGLEYNIYVSNDAGMSWVTAPGAPMISDLEYDLNGKLFGVFPGESYSSGLWSSNDNGLTWSVEFWATGINCVGTDFMGNVFVGFGENAQPPYVGIARWDSLDQQLYFMNDGLTNLAINQITINPGMSAPALFCCTDTGVFINYNYVGTTEQAPCASAPLRLWPNPAGNRFFVEHDMTGAIKAEIYSLNGRLIDHFMVDSQESSFEYPCSTVESGTYILLLDNGSKRIAVKWVRK